MPLKRLKNEYLEQDGVRFLMEDEEGSTVACSVSHEALRDHVERVHLSDTDATVFEAYRELIEQVASDAYDARALSMIMAEFSSPPRRSRGLHAAPSSSTFVKAFLVGRLAPVSLLEQKAPMSALGH